MFPAASGMRVVSRWRELWHRANAGCAVILALALATAGPNTRGAVPEETAKAVLVFHVIQFVSWPAAPATNAFLVGVLGTSSFENAVERVLAGERMEGRPIVVKRATSAAQLRDCQTVVINGNAHESLPNILTTLRGGPVLTIGENDGFAANGGMIGLTLNAQHKLRVQVNLEAVQAANLRVSAQLLRVADVVKGAPM